MGKSLRQTIIEITYHHLKKEKGQVFGQNLTGVGWVDGTLPKLYEKDGIVELPMADVSGGGIVAGSALVGKKPFYIIRYQGYNWFNCIFIANYACKSKELWKIPAPMFIRGISAEGHGPIIDSSHISMFYKMPGIKIFSPMTTKEYKNVYKQFLNNNDVFYVSEHRKSYENSTEFKNIIKKKLDIILMPISVTRFDAAKAVVKLNKLGFKVGIIHLVNLKPFNLKKSWIEAIRSCRHGVLMTDNDYKDGILRTMAHKINEKTHKKVSVMGLEDKPSEQHSNVYNIPPNTDKIIKKVLKIIK